MTLNPTLPVRWCLMECMFADASKTPRFIFTKDGSLRHLTADMKLENKTPIDGSFTVESDRAIMRVLSLVANSITGKIDRGVSMSVLSSRPSKEGSAGEVPPAEPELQKERPSPMNRMDSRISG